MDLTGFNARGSLHSKSVLNGGLERPQAAQRGIPDNAKVEIIITMTKVVADAADVGPWLIGPQDLGLCAQAVGCLADGQHGILHRENDLLVAAEGIEIHAGDEPLDASDIVEDVLQ